MNGGAGSIEVTDLDATGTVTADEVNLTGGGIKLNGSTRVLIRSGDTLFYRSPCPSSNEGVDLGVASRRWLTTHTVDLDAIGTVTAGGFVGTHQTLTDAASITYDLANGHNAKVTLTDDRILLFPTNIAEGASGVLTVTQDGTGGRALAFGTGWFISAGAAADIAALGAGEKAQVTWYAHSVSDANATILPLQ